jgi:hypothetical protein
LLLNPIHKKFAYSWLIISFEEDFNIEISLTSTGLTTKTGVAYVSSISFCILLIMLMDLSGDIIAGGESSPNSDDTLRFIESRLAVACLKVFGLKKLRHAAKSSLWSIRRECGGFVVSLKRVRAM